jgi:hypothetical protein
MHSNKISVAIGVTILAINIFLLVIYVQKQFEATIQFLESLLRMAFQVQPEMVGEAKNMSRTYNLVNFGSVLKFRLLKNKQSFACALKNKFVTTITPVYF